MSRLLGLNWQYVTDYRDPKFMVSGTRIAQAVCGFQSRFAIVEIRQRDGSVRFGIADADTVTDAQVKAGKLPEIVKVYDDPEECLAAINRASEKLSAEFDAKFEETP